MANLYVFHEGSNGNNTTLWYTVFDGANWSPDSQFQNLSLWGPPAAMSWAGGGITVFHGGWNGDVGPDGNLWYSYSPDGTNWEADTPVPALPQGGFAAPSPVVYNGNGKLYLFYDWGLGGQGPFPPIPGPHILGGGGDLRRSAVRQSDAVKYGLSYSVFDGTTWNFVQTVPANPNTLILYGGFSAVNYRGGITVFHPGATDPSSLWYTYSRDGINWEPDTQVQNVGLSGSPSALVYNGNLYVFHQGYGNNGQLWYSVFDGTNWAPDTLVTTLALWGSPSAVAWDGGITVFHQGGGGDETLRYTYSPDGINWGADYQIPNVYLTDSPSAVVI